MATARWPAGPCRTSWPRPPGFSPRWPRSPASGSACGLPCAGSIASRCRRLIGASRRVSRAWLPQGSGRGADHVAALRDPALLPAARDRARCDQPVDLAAVPDPDRCADPAADLVRGGAVSRLSLAGPGQPVQQPLCLGPAAGTAVHLDALEFGLVGRHQCLRAGLDRRLCAAVDASGLRDRQSRRRLRRPSRQQSDRVPADFASGELQFLCPVQRQAARRRRLDDARCRPHRRDRHRLQPADDRAAAASALAAEGRAGCLRRRGPPDAHHAGGERASSPPRAMAAPSVRSTGWRANWSAWPPRRADRRRPARAIRIARCGMPSSRSQCRAAIPADTDIVHFNGWYPRGSLSDPQHRAWLYPETTQGRIRTGVSSAPATPAITAGRPSSTTAFRSIPIGWPA